MGVVDWRAWTNQGGGSMPTAPNPPGTPYVPNTPFPGVGPITDLINPATSIPSYSATPTTIKPVDPFGGWVDQKEFVANSAGAQVPTMRPAIPGLTSP